MVLRKKKKRHRNKPAKPRKQYSKVKVKLNTNKFSIREKLFLFFVANPFGWLFMLFMFVFCEDVVLDALGTQTCAVITPRLSRFTRRNTTQEFIYEFEYKGNIYEGNSRINSKHREQIGNHIDVVFINLLPSINKPAGSSSIY